MERNERSKEVIIVTKEERGSNNMIDRQRTVFRNNRNVSELAIRDTSVKDVVTFSTTFHPGFFDDLALLFVL